LATETQNFRSQKLKKENAARKEYEDPIKCPVCGKVFAEWEKVEGSATVKKWCPVCKEMKYITKKA
jgi:phage FluMu protein Com